MMIRKNFAFILTMTLLITLLGCPAVSATAMDDVPTGVTGILLPTTAEQEGDATTVHDTETTTAGETVATAAPTQQAGGRLRTAMIILERDGKLAVRVTDTNGRPVEGILVGLQLGTTRMPGEYTDESGYATFRYALPKDGTYVYCYSEVTEIDGVIYEGASASVGRQATAETTMTGSKEDTATTYRQGSTAAKTSKKNTTKKGATTTKPLTRYTAPGTTGMEDSFVVLDLSFDSGILDSFGIDQQGFADKARLLLDQETYATIIGDINGILMLSAATSQSEVTDEQLAAALQNDKMLSRINTAHVSRIVMDLSMQYRDTVSGEFIPTWNTAEGSYVIQLPVPDAMRSAQTVAVSAVTADGISEPVIASVSKDGILRFETSSPVGTIVLLGFKTGVLGALTSHATRTALIFLIIGILCIGGAVFLYVRFVHQPKKSKKKANDPVADPQDIPAVDTFVIPPSETEPEEPLGGLDIFAESDEATPKKNPADYDIDL